MKIVYDAALFRGAGGGPRHYEGISRALHRCGAEVVHVVPAETAINVDALPGRVVPLRVLGQGRVARQVGYELARALLILRWFVTGRRFDVWMTRGTLFGVSLGLARLVARRVVIEVNGPVREEMRANFGSPLMAGVVDIVFRLQVGAAHMALAVTPGLAQYIETRRPRRPAHVLPNGADSLAGAVPASDAHGLIFVGALTPWYDLDTVLAALAQLRDDGEVVDLEIVGDGSSREAVEASVHRLGLEASVQLRGWLDPAEVQQRLLAARVGVLPLVLKQEGLDVVGSPLKLYEYAAASLRVIGTDIDGISNAPARGIVHAYTTGDPTSCAAAIRAALAAPRAEVPEALWSWDARARDLLALLDR